MRFLITGAAGFLGAPLANKLAQDGHTVVGLDDLSTGDPARLLPEVNFIRGDVNDRPKLWSMLQDVDCVYHLAARVIVSESIIYPREYTQVNVGGTVTLMEAMRDVGVSRVVFISSGSIYGNQSVQPLKETCRPHPHSPYAVSKLSAEYYIRTIGDLWGIETVCLRVFNAYGPGQRLPPSYAPVIPHSLRQALDNGTIVVHGDGKQTRDYVFIDDVVSAMASTATASGVDHLIMNIGSGQETSVSQVVKLVLEVTGRNPQVIYNTKHEGGPSRMYADISLAHKKLGYSPQVNLKRGLKMTIDQDARFKKQNPS